jgi:tetratricopeptide (TPR) repeat protein
MRLILLAALLLPTLACRSNNKAPDLTKEQKLGVYMENALRYFNLRDLDRTEHQALRGLALDPRNERFLLILGSVHLRRGQTEDILAALEIFDEHPNQADYRVLLGKGEAHERLSVLEDEAADSIEDGERYTEGDIQEKAAKLRASAREHLLIAQEQFRRAEQVHKGELNAVNGLIRTSALLGEDEESIKWSRTLIEILGTSSNIRRQELEDVELLASREAELLAAIRRNTNMVIKTHLHVASLMRRQGRKQEAADELGMVTSLDPEFSQAYSRRAQLYFAMGQYIKAKESVQHYIELEAALPYDDPQMRAAYDLLARCDAALEGQLSAGN